MMYKVYHQGKMNCNLRLEGSWREFCKGGDLWADFWKMDKCLSHTKRKAYSSPQGAHAHRHSGEKRYRVFRKIQAHLHCWSTVWEWEAGGEGSRSREGGRGFIFHTKMLELYPGSFLPCSPGSNHQWVMFNQVIHLGNDCPTWWAETCLNLHFKRSWWPPRPNVTEIKLAAEIKEKWWISQSVQSLSCVWLFATPWITARQASLSITNSRSLYSNSCPSSQWYHPAISSSVVPFSSCPQSLPASRSFPMSQLTHEVAKVLEFQLQHQSFQWTPRIDLL